MNHRRCYTSLELATPPSKVCRAIRWETNSSDFSVRHLNAFPIWLEIALPRRSYFPMAGIQWEVKTFRKSSPYIRPRVPGERLFYFVSSLSVVRGSSKLRVPAVWKIERTQWRQNTRECLWTCSSELSRRKRPNAFLLTKDREWNVTSLARVRSPIYDSRAKQSVTRRFDSTFAVITRDSPTSNGSAEIFKIRFFWEMATRGPRYSFFSVVRKCITNVPLEV